MGRLGDFLPIDQTIPVTSIATSEAVANITGDGLDPDYKGEPITSVPSSWILYALIALALYFLLEEV